MISFGGDAIDNLGVVRDFPARSMLTGLLANALGFDRAEGERLDALQARLIHASFIARPGRRERDYQTARLFGDDRGWTTRGAPEGRASSPSFDWDEGYERDRGERRKALTHQRYRDFDADACVLVALRLADADENGPPLEELADALDRPERPLFIGRKPNLPARPLLWRREGDWRVRTVHAVAALCEVLDDTGGSGGQGGEAPATLRAQWSPPAGPDLGEGDAMTFGAGGRSFTLQAERCGRIGDERRHVAGIHAGTRAVIEGRIEVAGAAPVAVAASDGLPDLLGDWT